MISSAATTKIKEEDRGLEEEVKMEKEMGETVVPPSLHDDEVKKIGRPLAVTSIALALAILTGTLYHR